MLRQNKPSEFLDSFATSIEVRYSWQDLVATRAQLTKLHEIIDQVRTNSTETHSLKRGLGVKALFVGESSIGKTLAAEVVACELKQNLYRIDLSAVVSKYIGETEKNLRRLFDAAEDGGVILFFDEADALFDRRSNVQDSHDRYADRVITCLLQKMEKYQGLSIIAIKKKSVIDPSYLRRMRFVVNFPFPSRKAPKHTHTKDES